MKDVLSMMKNSSLDVALRKARFRDGTPREVSQDNQDIEDWKKFKDIKRNGK